MWRLKLTGLSPSSPQQLNYGYQNWESGDIIILNQSSGHHQNSRIPGWWAGDFCQPKLWRHRFTLDTRGSRSPFPLISEDEDKPKFITKKQDSERGFLSRQKASSILVPRLLPFWTLLPLRPKDVGSSGILDEEPEHRDRNQQQEQESAGVSLANNQHLCKLIWLAL